MTPQLAHPPRDTDIRHDHGGPVLAVRLQESSALLSQRRAVAGEGDGRFARRVWPRVAAHPGLWRWLRLRYLSALVGYPNFLLRRRPVVLALAFVVVVVVYLTDSISIDALALVSSYLVARCGDFYRSRLISEYFF